MDHLSSDVGERAPGIRLIRGSAGATSRGTIFLGSLGIALAAVLAACGGGGGSAPAPISPLALLAGAISGPSPVASACTGGSTTGSFFANAEVEPFVAIDPGNSNHLVATWQQDRWTDGGARAIVTAASFDGGRSWTRVLQPMSRCGGGTPARGGDFERASDPWVDIGPDGTVHALALVFSGNASQSPANAVLASRSVDGGLTWSAPATLASDGAAFFNDKTSLTADPTDPSHVYAVWDRLVNATGAGPTMLARSTDSGVTWEPARAIYAPPGSGQTIGNRIVALTGGSEAGTLIDFFTQIDFAGAAPHLDVIRSTDKGTTWSAPLRIAALQSVGTRDPETGTLARDGSIIGSIAAGPGGVLWATWQDARFSGGARDAIAIAHSNDGGRTWSAPVAVNRDPTVAAFTPVINVRADATVGVLHYDLRPNSAASDTLLAAAWLLTSRDGIAWTETSVWSPFDLDGAPRVVDGLFLGDYEGLVSTNTTFLPVLVLSDTDASNRTDVYAMTFAGLAVANADPARMHVARAANPASAEALPPAVFAGRVRDHTARSIAARLPTGAAGGR